MKLFVTGAGGQLGHDVVAHAARGGRRRGGGRPCRRSTSPTATAVRSSDPRDPAGRDHQRRGVHRRRRVRDERRGRPSDQRRRGRQHRDGRGRGRRPPRPRQHRLRVRRHARPPVPRGRRDEPAIGVRDQSKLAGERLAGPEAAVVRTSWVCGEHGNNMVKLVLRLAGAGRRPGLRRRPAGLPDVHGRPRTRRSGRSPPNGSAGVFHLTNAGPRVVVRVRAGDPAGRRATIRSRWSGRSRPPSSIRRVRRPGRPTACSTTRGGGRPA